MEDNVKMYWTPNEIRTKIFSENISRSTLLMLIHRKKIPAIRLGNRWYIPAWWVNQQIEIARGGGTTKDMIMV